MNRLPPSRPSQGVASQPYSWPSPASSMAYPPTPIKVDRDYAMRLCNYTPLALAHKTCSADGWDLDQ